MSDRIFGLPIKYLSLLILVFQNSMLVIVMRYSRTSSDTPYYASTAVFFCEFIKLFASLLIFLRSEFSFHQNNPFHALSLLVFAGDSWKMIIPAFLYTIQNNLQYHAVSLLDPATFQVSYQLKILTTAIFSVILLKRVLGSTKWLSLLLLTTGIALVQLQTSAATASPSKKTGTIKKFEGLFSVSMACILSGLSGVYFELVLKSTNKSLWLRNVQLSLYSLVPATLGIVFTDGPAIAANGIFYGYTYWTLGSILCQSAGGLVVAVVVKYADNILKGFATSISIIVSCVLSVFIFDFQITYMFVVGTIIVIYSTYLYGLPSKQSSDLPKSRSASG